MGDENSVDGGSGGSGSTGILEYLEDGWDDLLMANPLTALYGSTAIIDDSTDSSNPIGAALDEAGSAVSSAVTSATNAILPSSTTVWTGIVAIIVILGLVAYISREVAG
jgi:hypothetical protein